LNAVLTEVLGYWRHGPWGRMENKLETPLKDPLHHMQSTLITAAGAIRCPRCQGLSRRTGVQCGAPAERGRRWCRFHGGRSRGPTTAEGRQRCAEARMTHGQETREQRKERSKASAELAVLEQAGHVFGFCVWPAHQGQEACPNGRSLARIADGRSQTAAPRLSEIQCSTASGSHLPD
jgi:hypothetical protein